MPILNSRLLAFLTLVLLACSLLSIAPRVDAQVVPVDWQRLSSNSGDLPVPPDNQGQSGLRVVDLDQNGQNDYVMTLWYAADSIVWYRQIGNSFQKYVIDSNTPHLSHGERYKDIDNDGDLDLLFGDASGGTNIYWWENPYPNFDPNTPWTRRTLYITNKAFFHDNIWGDFDNDGDEELMAWNQKRKELLLLEVPSNPKSSGLWPATVVFGWDGVAKRYKGADIIDIDLDGKPDFVGGCSWFKHEGGTNFTRHPIDDSKGYSQIKAGQFVTGGRPEVLCLVELDTSDLNMYQWNGSTWQAQTLIANMPSSHTLQVGDINLDGHLDIVAGEMNRNKLYVLYGDGAGNFVTQIVADGYEHIEGQLADMDNDGDLDILTQPFSQDAPRIDLWVNLNAGGGTPAPDVVGLSQSAAETEITNAGLTLGSISSVNSANVPSGDVISQDPAAGALVAAGSAVDLVISLGPAADTTVPDVTGIPQADAESNLIAANLVVGDVIAVGNASVPAGHVVDHDPPGGSVVPEGTAVDLQVSVGASAFFENFDGYAPGADPNEWLDTEANSGLNADDSLFQVLDVGADRSFGTTSTARNIHSHYTGSALGSLNGYEFSGRMRMSSASGGIGVTFFSQYPAADVYYRLRCYNGGSFHIAPHGTSVSGDSESGVTPLANQWYQFRVQVEDTGTRTNIRARLWLSGDSEPAEWQIDAFDASATRLTGGTLGVWAFKSGSKYWDDLTVAGGTPTPGVLGLSQSAAEAAIVGAGLSVGTITSVNSASVPSGDVISQTPAAGSLVAAGSPVDLVISLGPAAQVVVPDVAGLSQANAEADIVGADLTVGDISLTGSPTVPAGDVISQDPPGGTTVPSGTSIDLWVSTGATAYQENFDGYATGSDPADWLDTDRNNSLSGNDSLFKVFDLGGEQVFGTTSTDKNIHSHYTGSAVSALAAYEYSGRMRITDPAGGIGVTFFSQYPGADVYYRLRRYGNSDFHINPHGTSVNGTTASGVVPAANQWYRFRIEVEDTGSRTDIRARIWPEGDTEPTNWQIDAFDNSGTRLTGGTIGVWSHTDGSKYWDDLMVK